jgi:hypothetical protein
MLASGLAPLTMFAFTPLVTFHLRYSLSRSLRVQVLHQHQKIKEHHENRDVLLFFGAGGAVCFVSTFAI